jgi:AraC-like DNA-binding protein
MLLLEFDNQTAFKFSSSGNLVNNEGFLHGDRCLDTFVLLVGNSGNLHIAQNERKYILSKNQYLILFPGYRHYGYKQSEDILSYFWCHFYIPEGKYRILTEDEQEPYSASSLTDCNKKCISLIPEFGECLRPDRINLQFRHLIDTSRDQNRLDRICDLTISLLILEMAHMYTITEIQAHSTQRMNPITSGVIDYIHHNYSADINVAKVAKKLGYNPNYISVVFRKTTGISLLHYINSIRIDAAKNLLLNSSNSIKFIAAQVGFNDEKHFMKLFRSFENTTPTKYRKVYLRNHINTQ